jgi:4-hydroxybenzoate polyprenyltransferase
MALVIAGLQFAWQVATLNIAYAGNCLARFKSNRWIGWLLFAGLAADMALAALLDAY